VHKDNPGCAGRIQGARGESRVCEANPGLARRIEGEQGESRQCQGASLTKKYPILPILPWYIAVYHGETDVLGHSQKNI
jgi:hypothetical protein